MKGREGTSRWERVVSRLSRIPRWCGLCLIKFYQCCISPLFPACCRYIPTCSQYALVAVERFGLLKGSWLALKRIARCHPLHAGGYDPVPEEFHFFRGGRSSQGDCMLSKDTKRPEGTGSGDDEARDGSRNV